MGFTGWRSAQLSREILEKLSKTIDQLKVVMKASDSLSGQVNGLYEVEKSFRAEEETEHSLKIKRKRHKMSENETPKDEDLNEEASLEENSGQLMALKNLSRISNVTAEGADEEIRNQSVTLQLQRQMPPWLKRFI